MFRKGPKHKVVRVPEFKDVVYGNDRWALLRKLREVAAEVMKVLVQCGYSPIVHGSVARGDVDQNSDVDVVIPYTVAPAVVEACLDRGNLRIYRKTLVRATPKSALKVVYELTPNGDVTISFPLERFNPRELEFYKFGGSISYEDLAKDIRKPGVTKSLILIIPTEGGHREAPVVGYEYYVAKLLGVSIDTVRERVEILRRRDEVGRTGLFFKVVLDPSVSVEEVVREVTKKAGQRDRT
ncbi:MAG: nucleotidyltransferase domain-containing protein [Sulfolobales archaeon]